MKAINPWINFNGNTEEAFTFYKSVFGGEFTKITRFKDLAGPDFQVPEDEANKIMYIGLQVSKNNVLVANDVPGFMGRVSENENRSKIYLNVESREEADKYLMHYLRVERWKGLLAIVHGVLMPECLEINMVLNGL